MIFHNRFKDKVAIVTGAAQGIGKGVAIRIANEGAKTVLVDRSSVVFDIADQLKKEGFDVIAVQADLETFEGFQNVAQQTVRAFGKIEILINNVGGTIWAKPFEKYEED